MSILQTGAKTTTIHFQLIDLGYEQFHPVVQILLNNQLASMIIDTGATQTTLDFETAELLWPDKDWKNTEFLTLGFNQIDLIHYQFKIQDFKINNLHIADFPVAIMDMCHVNNMYKEVTNGNISGVIGNDLLMRFKAVINYHQKTLRVSVN